MTYYSSNELNAAQVYWAKRPNDIIMRPGSYPFLEIALRNAPLFLADFNQIKQSDKRAVTAHSLDRSPAPTTNARSCTHTSCCGDCTETHLTWQTFTAANICMSMDRSSDNMFDWDAQFANQVRNRQLDLLRDIETWGVAYALAGQTTVHNGVTGLGTWVNDIFRVAFADRLQCFSYFHQVMLANNYGNFDLDVINTLSLGGEFNFINQQGSGNAYNLSWQNAGITMWQSTILPVTAGYFGNCIILPKGSAGCVPWIPMKNRNNTGVMGGAAGYWTSMPDLFGLGLQFAVHITETCADTSQTNGTTQDYVRNYEISIDIAGAMTPMAGGETPVYHMGLFAT